MKEVKRVTLCGVQGCCPEVVISTKSVVITDDNGGKVTLTKEEFNELKKIRD